MPGPTLDGVPPDPIDSPPSCAAVVIAGHTGDQAVVDRGLMSPDPAVRTAALGARSRLGRLDVVTVLDGLHDPNSGVQRRAVELSVELDPASAMSSAVSARSIAATGPHSSVAPAGADPVDQALVALLLGGDAMLVEVAAWALGERHTAADDDAPPPSNRSANDERRSPNDEPGRQPSDGGPGRPIMVSALSSVAQRHEDALCREAAVAALGSIGDPAGKAAILSAMGDKATVRRRAVLALARFDGPDVDAVMARARSDRDWQVRQAAEDLSC